MQCFKATLILSFFLLIATLSFAETFKVERVLNGDTLKITNAESVRLIGIDTPESRLTDKAKRDAVSSRKEIESN